MPVNSFENYPMSWKPDLSKTTDSKHIALAKILEEDIKSGVLKAGTKLPPQRELADFLDVNLSTISKAFKLCAQKGLLSASVGNGTYVSADAMSEKVFLCNTKNQNVIDMGAIIPSVKTNAAVMKYVEKLLKEPNALDLFSYGANEGTLRQREAGVIWLQKEGVYTDSNHIVLSAGGQNALMAALGALFKCGDRIGTDPMTYPGIKIAAKLIGIQLIPIQSRNYEMTEEGIRYAIQNENIKGLYTVPNYHNPTSHIMSLETRKMIARIAREEKLIVIEDGINNMLMEKPEIPIAAFAPEQILYISSISKSVCAGLRTAFVYVPDNYHKDFADALYSMNISLSPLLAELSAVMIEDGIVDEIIEERKKDIIERNIVVNEMLDEFLIESKPTSPLRYIHLPERFTGESFEAAAKAAGVQIFGAEHFSVGKKPAEKMVRIAVTTPSTIEELTEGVKRLKALLQN